MFTGINHVALVVRSLDASVPFYRDVLGLPLGCCETVQEQGVRAALFPLKDGEIELLEPVNPAGGVAKFLERRGEGLHHVCITTTDVEADLAAVKAAGLPAIDQAPRQGLAGRISFLHPSAGHGVLVELAQPLHTAAHAASGGGIGAVALQTVYAGVKNPAEAARTFVAHFAARPAERAGDGGHGAPAVAVQLGPTALAFLGAEEVAAGPFQGRPAGLWGVCVTVKSLEAARRHLAAAGDPADAVGPSVVRVDGRRTNGMVLLLAQA
jgi:methylmalonyl-CoA/ethylmalonyl-CoA epimerase